MPAPRLLPTCAPHGPAVVAAPYPVLRCIADHRRRKGCPCLHRPHKSASVAVKGFPVLRRRRHCPGLPVLHPITTLPTMDSLSYVNVQVNVSPTCYTLGADMALQLFFSMLNAGFEPNEITLASALSAVAESGTLEQGRWIHDYIINRSIRVTDNLSAGLIDMYAKCGSITDAVQLFNHASDKFSSISPWNAMICSLAVHGYAHMSLDLFSHLQRTDIKPNSITFIGVLNACCHTGMVTEGKQHFESMRQFGIQPTIKHYGCLVDLLGRAGYLEEAEQLVVTMPMKADTVIWGSILSAARAHDNVGLGERAAEELAKLDQAHGASKVALSNIYAYAGRWANVSVVRKELEHENLERQSGSSGIA